MNADEIVKALRCVQEKHRNDRLLTFQTDVSAMARDAADMIESLQAQHKQAALNYQQKCRDVVELESQLSASQRREKAAVEDLENLIDRECACSYCSHLLETGACALDIKYGDGTCSAQWRGPQDEKGENHE